MPDTVLVQNLPITSKEQNQYTRAVFAQDSWHFKRLTLTGGLRWEAIRSRVPEQESAAGRFVPARQFAAVENVPNWRDLAPRFGLVYDVRGDGRTAFKYSLNRYNQWEAMALAGRYNPLALTTTQLRWTNLNGDDIAQGELGCRYLTTGCEIDFSTLPTNFGVRALSRPQALERWYTLENGVEVQHAFTPALSLSGSFVRGNFHDIPMSYNSLRTPADFTPVQIFNPQDGTPLTIYNVKPEKANAVAIIDTSSSDQRKTFTGYTLSFNVRLPKSITAFGGFNAEFAELADFPYVSLPLSALCVDRRDLPVVIHVKLVT